MRGGPVYIVKPKYIFKHPFNKYDLANPTNRQTQNQELTDYFNYGFNEDTMNIYGKLVKRFIEVLDHHKNLEYFNQPSQLMRLNDEMPMDFGGFCKFHDPWIVDNDTSQNFHNGDILLKYFIMTIFANVNRKTEYPLIQFIKSMYKKEGEQQNVQDTFVYDVIEQIDKNLEHKYQETMKKIYEKQNQIKVPISQKKVKEQKKERDPRERQKDKDPREKQRDKDRELKEREKDKDKERQKQKQKIKQQVKPKKTEKRRSQSPQSSDGSSDSYSSSQTENKKRRRQERDRSEDRNRKRQGKDKGGKKRDRSSERKRKDKERKDKHKSKKVKKEKSYRRSKSKSRDRKKKHH